MRVLERGRQQLHGPLHVGLLRSEDRKEAVEVRDQFLELLFVRGQRGGGLGKALDELREVVRLRAQQGLAHLGAVLERAGREVEALVEGLCGALAVDDRILLRVVGRRGATGESVAKPLQQVLEVLAVARL